MSDDVSVSSSQDPHALARSDGEGSSHSSGASAEDLLTTPIPLPAALPLSSPISSPKGSAEFPFDDATNDLVVVTVGPGLAVRFRRGGPARATAADVLMALVSTTLTDNEVLQFVSAGIRTQGIALFRDRFTLTIIERSLPTPSKSLLVSTQFVTNPEAERATRRAQEAADINNRLQWRRYGLGGENERTHVLAATAADNFVTFESCLSVSAGAWYYEVSIIHVTKGMQIGWASEAFTAVSAKGEGVGDDRHSWAYDGVRHRAWTGGRWIPYATEVTWVAGMVIGCMVDLTRGSIRFFANGEDLGEAFREIRVGKTIRPAVSLPTLNSVQIRVEPTSMTHFRSAVGAKAFADAAVAAESRKVHFVTAIQASALLGREDCLLLMAQHVERLESLVDEEGNNLLHLVAASDKMPSQRVLNYMANRGVSMTSPNMHGLSPIDVAIGAAHGPMAVLMLQHGYSSISAYVVAAAVKKQKKDTDSAKQLPSLTKLYDEERDKAPTTPMADGGGGVGGRSQDRVGFWTLASSSNVVYVGLEKKTATIYALAPELMSIVFSYLDPKSLAQATQTCRLWRIWATDDRFWKAFTLQDDWDPSLLSSLHAMYLDPMAAAKNGEVSYRVLVGASYKSLMAKTERQKRVAAMQKLLEVEETKGVAAAVVQTYVSLGFAILFMVAFNVLWPLRVENILSIPYTVVLIPLHLAIFALNTLGVGTVFIPGNHSFLKYIGERTALGAISGDIVLGTILVGLKIDGIWGSWGLVFIPYLMLIGALILSVGTLAASYVISAEERLQARVRRLQQVKVGGSIVVMDLLIVLFVILFMCQVDGVFATSWWLVNLPLIAFVLIIMVGLLVAYLKFNFFFKNELILAEGVLGSILLLLFVLSSFGDVRSGFRPPPASFSFGIVMIPILILEGFACVAIKGGVVKVLILVRGAAAAERARLAERERQQQRAAAQRANDQLALDRLGAAIV